MDKQVYLIVDAPTHGKAYHPNTKYEISDNYPKEDEKKMLEKLCCHFRRNKVGLTVIKCRGTVNHMVETMKVWYKSGASELNTINLCRRTGRIIAMSMKERLGMSLAKGISTTFKDFEMSTQIFNRPAGVSCPEPEHMMMQSFKALKYTCYIKDGPSYERGMYDYSFMMDLAQSEECSFKVSSDVLGTRRFNGCRYLKACGDDTPYVTNVPKEPTRALAAIAPAAECYIVTRLFATAFCEKLKMDKLIAVPSILILGLQKGYDISLFNNSTFLLVQEYITGEYVKYNNNYGWVMDGDDKTCQLAQAFSHFTYEHSNGTLIIVDIQGVWNEEKQCFLLIDPAIHSIYRKKSYGISDMGKLGVLRFFKTHKCNDICRKLNLLDVTPNRLKAIDDRLRYEECKKSSKFRHVYYETMESVFEKFKNFDPEKEPALATLEEEDQYPLPTI
ncbi:MAG: alpha kinase family protein [Candidatus Pacebacteria bacterium]|nr:alpha kinase family protein [Candidatus Paceibacterota bacterium]